jgi:DNA-binding NarL/FixJ family response regulator
MTKPKPDEREFITTRQREMYRRRHNGQTIQSIADQYDLHYTTVKQHIDTVEAKIKEVTAFKDSLKPIENGQNSKEE